MANWTIPYKQRQPSPSRLQTPWFGLPGTGLGPGALAPTPGYRRLLPGEAGDQANMAPSTGENLSYGYPRDWGTDPTPGGETASWQIPATWLTDLVKGGSDEVGNWPAALNQLPAGDGAGRTVQGASAGTALAPTGDRAVQASSFPWMIIPALYSAFTGGGGGGGGGATAGQEGLLALQRQLLEQYGMPLLERGMGGLQEPSPENISRRLAEYRGTAETATNAAMTRALEQASQRGLEYGSWLPGMQAGIAGELGKETIRQRASIETAEKARFWQQLMSLLSAVPGMAGGAGQAAAGYGSLAESENAKQKAWGDSLAALLKSFTEGLPAKKTATPPNIYESPLYYNVPSWP